MSHFVYIVCCVDGTLYTGYATNLEKRVEEHNGKDTTESKLSSGAKYTRSRRPVRLVYFESFENRSDALRREYAIKQLSRPQKEALVSTQSKKRRARKNAP